MHLSRIHLCWTQTGWLPSFTKLLITLKEWMASTFTLKKKKSKSRNSQESIIYEEVAHVTSSHYSRIVSFHMNECYFITHQICHGRQWGRQWSCTDAQIYHSHFLWACRIASFSQKMDIIFPFETVCAQLSSISKVQRLSEGTEKLGFLSLNKEQSF